MKVEDGVPQARPQKNSANTHAAGEAAEVSRGPQVPRTAKKVFGEVSYPHCTHESPPINFSSSGPNFGDYVGSWKM